MSEKIIELAGKLIGVSDKRGQDDLVLLIYQKIKRLLGQKWNFVEYHDLTKHEMILRCLHRASEIVPKNFDFLM